MSNSNNENSTKEINKYYPKGKYYRVIEIIDKYSLIINYGKNQGAKKNDKVRIISTGPEVLDPLTKEKLGTLDAIKTELVLVEVYEQFSLCKKQKLSTENKLAGPLEYFQEKVNTIEALDVDEKSLSHKKAPDEKTIKVGDAVEVL